MADAPDGDEGTCSFAFDVRSVDGRAHGWSDRADVRECSPARSSSRCSCSR